MKKCVMIAGKGGRRELSRALAFTRRQSMREWLKWRKRKIIEVGRRTQILNNATRGRRGIQIRANQTSKEN
eukprot:9070824-Karenia_brevis.AAC.1